MIRVVKVVIWFSLLVSGVCMGQSGFSDYKKLSVSYLNAVYNSDTTGFRILSDKKVWQSYIECGIKEGDTSSLGMKQLVIDNYEDFFIMTYMKSFNFLRKELIKHGISDFVVDSVIIEQGKGSPCKEMPSSYSTIYITSNNLSFETRIIVVEFKKRWYLLGAPLPSLYKL
jgi:hypothetical protein